jgi:2,3-diketo-5-methylthiopentyl-1-phosphate enolase
MQLQEQKVMNIFVDYRFPPEIDAEKQAKIIAIGQTAGTWDDRFAHRETQLRQHLAEVVEIKADDRGYNIDQFSDNQRGK